MINLIWIKRNKSSKASTQGAEYSPSKQNLEKDGVGLPIFLWLRFSLFLEDLEPNCQITFPIFPVASPPAQRLDTLEGPLASGGPASSADRHSLGPPVFSSQFCYQYLPCWPTYCSASFQSTRGLREVMMMHYKHRPRQLQKSKRGL